MRLAQDERTDLVPQGNHVDLPTLAEAGIDKKLSSRAQKLAAVPEDQFEGMLGEWRGSIRKFNLSFCFLADDVANARAV